MLLSTAWFPPVGYFALLARDFVPGSPSVVHIEACETYCKQSWRNRCRILAADGPKDLNVPVLHDGGDYRHPIRQVRIDWSVPWLLRFERALASAYSSSAFYEHYAPDIFAILESRPEYLFDMNMLLTRHLLEKTGIEAELVPTGDWAAPPVPGGDDWRESIHPKKEDTVLRDLGLEKPYFQVFSRKYGFVPNLSILDLLFNEGPSSIVYLKNPDSLLPGKL